MISFRLNGQPARFDEQQRDTPLIYVLRDDALREMTPKFGCGLEQCGACRVLVDGSPEYACTLRAGAVADRCVETSAGMDDAVRRALIDANATQCGYCLPGIIVAAKAIIDENPEPSEDDIRLGISGNLCRCTGYTKIFEAIADAAAVMRAEGGEP